MKNSLKFLCLLPAIIAASLSGFSQVLDLGATVNFVAYTGNGAVTNAGISVYTGNAGADIGIISGFGISTTLNGILYNANSATAQAKVDLLNVYIHLSNIPVTNTSHAAAFGDETITAGVYAVPGAGSVGGTLILDAEGNTNAIFIMKFDGAFTATAGANVVLANGARSSNVFWISEGAIAIGASVVMKGTLFAHPGAVSFGTGGSLDGRMLTTEGAISFGAGIAAIPTTLSSVPITCVVSCSNAILGSAASYALFSSAGAVSNGGSSGFIGDIGSDAGAVTGFASSIRVGNIHNADAATVQAKIDLQNAYNQLILVPATNTAHAAAFGSGETLPPGVYTIAAAGSLAGTLTLDGGGNSNSLFMFRFGGAFNTAAQSKVILKNGARRCNIYWIAEGAIGMGAFTFMKGNLIAHDAANNMGANGNLEGRMFSTLGAVGFSTGVAYITYSLCGPGAVLPVKISECSGECSNGVAALKWTTENEMSIKHFQIERSTDRQNWTTAGKVNPGVASSSSHNYSFKDLSAAKSPVIYYRINTINLDGSNNYDKIISVKGCASDDEAYIYPALSSGLFNVFIKGDQNRVLENTVYNEQGRIVFSSRKYQQAFDLSGQPAGMYFLLIKLNDKVITRKFVLAK